MAASLRSTQRAPLRCTACVSHKIGCSKTIPCHRCIRLGIAHDCRREIVLVKGRVRNGHVASPNEDEDATRRENEALKLRLAETETQLQASNLRIAELQIAGHSRGTSSHSRSSDSSVEIDEIEVRDCIPSWQQARAVHQDPTNGWVISDHLRALVIHDDTHHSPATSARYSAQDFDDHLLISAVIYGWESIREYVEHEPQWIFLSAILDGNLLSDLDKINKLPGLLAVRRLLESVQGSASGDGRVNSLPSYTYPTELQRTVPHPAVIDFCAWPTMRQWALVNQDTYCCGLLQLGIAEHFRFRWPFAFSDAYHVDHTTGLFQFSSEFLIRVDDISCWTLEREFFQKYPQLTGSTECFEPTPSLIVPSTWVDGPAMASWARRGYVEDTETTLEGHYTSPSSHSSGHSSSRESSLHSLGSPVDCTSATDNQLMKAKHWSTILG